VSAAESVICTEEEEDYASPRDPGASSIPGESSNFLKHSLVETEKKIFQSKLNPHELRRKEQALQGLLWYGAYDEDLNPSHFKNIISHQDHRKSEEEQQEERYLKV
jgi:hypothetical protein